MWQEEEMNLLRSQSKADMLAQKVYADNHPVEQQDEGHFAKAAALLGPQFDMVPLVVPAGTVCVVDADLVHRAGRAAPNARWRPMLKLGARRVSAPSFASWNHDQSVTDIPVDSSADGADEAWQQHWSRLSGMHTPSAAAVDVKALLAKLEDGCERTRQVSYSTLPGTFWT
eukprot:COSAG02_NODE_27961_length_599_cov_1.012000_1_plen_171_part_00